MTEHDKQVWNEALEIAAEFLEHKKLYEAAFQVGLLKIGKVTEEDIRWAAEWIRDKGLDAT